MAVMDYATLQADAVAALDAASAAMGAVLTDMQKNSQVDTALQAAKAAADVASADIAAATES
jgi:hypothetical protein